MKEEDEDGLGAIARGGEGEDSPSISSALPSNDIDKRTREDGVR
jgi:hypothetical protein